MRLTRLSLIFMLLCGCATHRAVAQAPVTQPAPPVESTQPSTQPTTQPVAEAPQPTTHPTTAPIALAQINPEIDAAVGAVRAINNDLTPDAANPPYVHELDQLKAKYDAMFEETHLTVNSRPSVEALRELFSTWAEAWEPLQDWRRDLGERLGRLDQHVLRLAELAKTWTDRLGQAKAAGAPDDVVKRISALLDSINRARPAAEKARANVLALQNRATEQFNRVNDTLITIKAAQDAIVSKLVIKDDAPIWDEQVAEQSHEMMVSAQNSFRNQRNALYAYVARLRDVIVAHLICTILVIVSLHWVRRRVGLWTRDEPDLKEAFDVFSYPIATGLLISILVSGWIYPQAPRLMWAILGTAMMAPTIFLLRKLLDSRFHTLLDAVAIFWVIDQVRNITASQRRASRWLLLVEMLIAVLFVLWLIRSGQLKTMVGHLHNRIIKWVTVALRVAGVLFLASFALNLVGYTGLAKLLGGSALNSGYTGVILYAAAQVIDGVLMAALRLWPLTMLQMVRRHRADIHRRLTLLIRWGFVLWWAWITLDLFAVRGVVYNLAHRIVKAGVTFGPLQLSLWNFASFAFAIWGAFALSKLVRFLLDEDVYPRLGLPRGLPYAFSSVLHYTVLLIGFFTAVSALGYDLTKFTILAGAFGVGLGFGLQNIVNNFVSGIILLFERPLQVGDTIEIDGMTGTVRRIGIRASIIRTTLGSELIVPNSRLISEKVTNWTFSSGQRAIQLLVNVLPDSDPKRVMEVLLKTAEENELISQDPSPQVMMTTFNSGAMTFELQVWTKRYEDWQSAKSDLSIAVAASLKAAGISVK